MKVICQICRQLFEKEPQLNNICICDECSRTVIIENQKKENNMVIKKLNKNPMGVIRKIDKMGRICLPKEYLDYLKIKNLGQVEMLLLDDNTILLKKYVEKRNEDDQC